MNNEVIEYKLENHDAQLGELKEQVKKISDINTTLLLLQSTVSDLKDIVEDLKKDRDKEKGKPSKLQDKIQTGVIYTIVIGAVGFALKQIFGW